MSSVLTSGRVIIGVWLSVSTNTDVRLSEDERWELADMLAEEVRLWAEHGDGAANNIVRLRAIDGKVING